MSLITLRASSPSIFTTLLGIRCIAADWYSIGTEDGAKGYPLTRIGNYRKDCAEVGIAPDAEQYNQGRLVGLEQFCTYERGYSEGKRGASNRKVCPAGQLEARAILKFEVDVAR